MHQFSKCRHQLIAVALACVMVSGLAGCSRHFWRTQADQDTYRAISEKLGDPRWMLPRMDLTPDPRSRFFDPYDPDCAPLPPDDPSAHRYMHWVSKREGYKGWHKFGDLPTVENPAWLSPYACLLESADPVDGHAAVDIPKVKLRDCVELAYIHSREYQTQVEEVYLDALVLTEQRYNMGARFLINPAGLGGALADSTINRHGNQQARLRSGLGVQQLLPSGAQLSADILNTITWNLGSGTSSATRLAWSITQPLMNNAGRKIYLEGLTQSERSLLYQVRTMARFRQSFFTDVASDYLDIQSTQQQIINQVNNIRLLEEQIEIGQIQDSWQPGQVAEPLRRFPEGAVIPESLRDRLVYDEASRALKWTGDMTEEQQKELLAVSGDELYQTAAQQLIRWKTNQVVSLSVSQLITRLNRAESTLENSRRLLADQLDAYKIRLGLPPNIQLSLDTTFLNPFEVNTTELIEVQTDLKDFAKELGPDLIPANPGALRAPPEYAALKAYVQRLTRLRDDLEEYGLNQVRSDFAPLEEILKATESDLNSGSGRSFVDDEERKRVIADVARDLRLFRINERDFGQYTRVVKLLNDLVAADSLEELVMSLDKDSDGKIRPSELPTNWVDLPRVATIEDVTEMTPTQLISAMRDTAVEIREKLLQIAQGLQVVQVGLRTDAIALNRFTLPGRTDTPDIEEVIRIGLENRHDLMNAKAQVMDARRNVEIVANALMSRLDVRASGTLDPDGGANNDSVNLSLDFKTPIDQVAQRNEYRAALIDYQRQRRAYMEQEDRVKQQIRQSWRQLMVSRLRLEIDRQTVRNAALQYDNVATGQGQNNALSLLQALDSILQAQNALVSDWITYESNRLNIYRDMGIMDIDSTGIWTDDFYQMEGVGMSGAEPVTLEPLPVDATQTELPALSVPPIPPAMENDSND
ncbi:MAG: TolC family protein [Planctomycetaceae bacterium]|nr:TolC family protein [Planctomycetaceae bacterium]